MPLVKDLKIENVIILANSFNPTIFSTHWLITKGFCKEQDILPTTVAAQNFAQIMTKEFTLLVLPDQIQFLKAKGYSGLLGDLVKSKLLGIITLLKEVPYRSI